MSLKEKSPKDTYIKLMLKNDDARSVSSMVPLEELYHVVDITDAILEQGGSFGNESILGFMFSTENCGQSWTPVFYKWRLFDQICHEANCIFDASIVNEKQKKALKELFDNRLRDVFEQEAQTLDFAVELEKKKEFQEKKAN